ncbi:MAG: SGNH/GDSL hydrolase family protein [Bdellovibrionales bacterium]|nr:SGNH/GDSL hydrolase family protein [Oligoflexia bacterium]
MNKLFGNLGAAALVLSISACDFQGLGNQSSSALDLNQVISAGVSPTPPPVLPPVPTPGASASSFKIVIIGSSTAAGTGASSYANSWVSKMYTDLNYLAGVTLIQNNLALGGLNSSNLATTGMADRNITKALSLNPSLIIVALTGGNDLSSGVSETTYFSNLDDIKSAALARHVPIFFTGTSPKTAVTYDQRQELKTWNEGMLVREASCTTPLQDHYSPCFINVFMGLADPSTLMINSTYAYGDGTHLNDRGHAYYESVVLPVVKEYLCSLFHCIH